MKLTKNIKIAILILVLSLALGFIISQGTIFTFFQVGIATAIFGGLTLLTGILDLVIKKKFFVYPGLVTVGFIMAVGFGLIGFKFIQNQKNQTAEQLILKLKEHKADMGEYPDSLNELTLDQNVQEFNYRPDSSRTSYYLSFSLDGWHQKSYDSQTRNWTVSD